MWPIPADGYTFTQAFGCVPQLGNLYFADANCPPEAPVVHTGIDMAAPEGTPFFAAASGWVTLAGYDRPTSDANTRIIIQHDGKNEGYATEYLHWIASYVEVGDYVRAGQPIGEVGNVGFSTGPHLHFSVVDLNSGEHVDPVRWLPKDASFDGYPGRLPRAVFRLPAGTTAGQPEGADPYPPSVPTRVDVPDSPTDDNSRERSRKKHDRNKKRNKNSSSSITANEDSSGKNHKLKKKSGSKGDESRSDSTRKRDNQARDRDSGRNRDHSRDDKKSDRESNKDRRSKDRDRGAKDSSTSNRKSRKRENDDKQRRRDTSSASADDGSNQKSEGSKRSRASSGRDRSGDGRDRKSKRK